MTPTVMGLLSMSMNFKFSKENFVISPQVTFAGLSLSVIPKGDVDFLPDRDRVHEFMCLKTLGSKEELHPPLGLLATFHK